MLNNYAFSGTPQKPISYIEQGTKLTCQCGYEWIENRFPEYDKVACPRCQRRQIERDRRNLVQSSTMTKSLQFRSKEQSEIDGILELFNFGSIDPVVIG
jgi:hypothetical protein